jgi:hypothetical protein
MVNPTNKEKYRNKNKVGNKTYNIDILPFGSNCSITNQKVDIAPTPRLINFFKRLRL